ncbi:zinc finger protein 667 isoform X9 [Manis javanica]|uniref:zinc finger protein 667 isoform X9 n=1 Tax=Manis javanica TaxID=9974 RepID=UPI003C6D3F9D
MGPSETRPGEQRPSAPPLSGVDPPGRGKDVRCSGENQVQGFSFRRPNVIALLEKREAPWVVEPARRRQGPDCISEELWEVPVDVVVQGINS